MQIRRATLADVSAIVYIERQSPTAGHWSEQQYRFAINYPGGGAQRLVLVAQHDDETLPIAFLVAHHVASDWELENIVVSPQVRRTGCAKQLLNALLTRARDTNSDSIFLEVRESNAAARTLYERAGFEETGRRKSYYANPEEDAILYRLSLK
jgi:ribosomal-protein-alanine N-acetyltransferase